MQILSIVIAGVILTIAAISFLIVLRLLSRSRKEEVQITGGEFDNSRDTRLLEELKARQDQDKAALLESLSERLGEISQKIENYNKDVLDFKASITPGEQGGVNEDVIGQMNKKIEEVEATINNLLNTLKDDRAILIGWIKEEMRAVVNTTKLLNENLQSLQAFLHSKKDETGFRL